VVNPRLGAGLLAGEPEQADLPPSFDQLLSRSTGAVSMPNALILSQAPEVAPISAPMSATGEVLITGTFNLPEGLGSTGHALGTADGKEVDATLVDGELPAHSSPTPIAASAAISTVKSAGEVIKPPAPEKGSKLMLTLAITAGALALALVGVLILAFVTGCAVMTASAQSHDMLQIAAVAADAKGGEDLLALDVSEPLPLVDVFLLVTGRSERNVAAIADEIEDQLLEAGHKRLRREGRQEARWVLLDFGDLVVHVFHEQERVYYGLERLWKDCPVVPIELPAPAAAE
jgi:ribosome silencing factor RsfS/YbeB/iojap